MTNAGRKERINILKGKPRKQGKEMIKRKPWGMVKKNEDLALKEKKDFWIKKKHALNEY